MTDRISIDIEGLREPLELLASREERNLNQMIRFLIKEGLERRQLSTFNTNTSEVADFIKLLANGERPLDAQIIEIAHDLDIEEEKLVELRDRLFPNRDKLANGA